MNRHDIVQDRRLKTARGRAWRNTMVAAINAGLEQKLFGLQPGQDYWPKAPSDIGKHFMFDFAVGDIPGLGYVGAIGWDELVVHAALWPTADARNHLGCGNITGTGGI